MPTCATDVRPFYLLMAPLILGPLLVALDVLALAVAMPSMANQLKISYSQVSLTFILYTLMFSGLILPVGRLMDRSDCYALLRWGYWLFAAGSVCCMLAQEILWLCIGRCVQGIGGAVLYAVTPVLVKRVLPEDRQDRGYTLLVMASYLGILAGPTLGGMITSLAGWHWIFAMNLPPVCVGLVLIRHRAAAPEPGQAATPFDYAGAIYSFLASSLSIFVLNQGKELGWSSVTILLATGCCLFFLMLFLIRQYRFSHPLIDLSLLRIRAYRCGLMTASIAMGTGTGLTFLYPFFLSQGVGLSTMQSGVMIGLEPIFSILASAAAAPLAAWVGYRTAITGTMGLRLFAVLLLTLAAQSPTSMPVAVAFGLSGLATGLQYGPLMGQVMAAIPQAQTGAGGALFSQARLFAQVMGVVLFETLFSQLQDLTPSETGSHDAMNAAFRACFLLAAALLIVAAWYALGLQSKSAATEPVARR